MEVDENSAALMSNDMLDNEMLDNGKPCHEHGRRDLCDDLICENDGQCRSGCCSQVLTKGYSRCASMLVGFYCPRALDPIFEIMGAEHELVAEKQMLGGYHHGSFDEHGSHSVEPAELPCNVFGTVDRCDGMACEHDGNCFSGCCSVFVQGESQRCMPLVGGDLCPIAIDVVEPAVTEHHEEKEQLAEHHLEEEYDSPLHYVGHKEHGFED